MQVGRTWPPAEFQESSRGLVKTLSSTSFPPCIRLLPEAGSRANKSDFTEPRGAHLRGMDGRGEGHPLQENYENSKGTAKSKSSQLKHNS